MKTVLDRNERQVARQTESYIFKTPSRLYEGYLQKLDFLDSKLVAAFEQRLSKSQRAQLELNGRLKMVDPKPHLDQLEAGLSASKQQLKRNMQRYLTGRRSELAQAAGKLNALSPLSIMGRGYSYVSNEGKIAKSVNDLNVDDKVLLHLADGTADARIIATKEENVND